MNHALQRILNDIQKMTFSELEDKYGIEINDASETVYDRVEMKEFDSLHAWAIFAAEQEESDYNHFEKIGGKQRFDDEY